MLLMLVSIGLLFLFIHHTAERLRGAGLIDFVGDSLRVVIDEHYPPPERPAASADVIAAPAPGTVVLIREPELVEAARAAGCMLELLPAMGDFVPAGAPLLRVHGDGSRLDRDAVAGLVMLASERTHESDPSYGFRKLVDIAERSIAQPFQDPTTAVQAIDRLHDCLRQLAPRPFPGGDLRDARGELRLTVRRLEWEGYVRLAFDELRLAGASSPQVTRRLTAALTDLMTVAPPERRPALERQLELLAEAVCDVQDDDRDVVAALVADAQGIGSGEDLLSTRARS
jgi:uncharacterized membrane protein